MWGKSPDIEISETHDLLDAQIPPLHHALLHLLAPQHAAGSQRAALQLHVGVDGALVARRVGVGGWIDGGVGLGGVRVLGLGWGGLDVDGALVDVEELVRFLAAFDDAAAGGAVLAGAGEVAGSGALIGFVGGVEGAGAVAVSREEELVLLLGREIVGDLPIVKARVLMPRGDTLVVADLNGHASAGLGEGEAGEAAVGSEATCIVALGRSRCRTCSWYNSVGWARSRGGDWVR